MPRLLGLCQLQPDTEQGTGPEAPAGGGMHMWAPWVALLRSPVLPDLLVWLLLRLYVRLRRSRVFVQVGWGGRG